MPLSRRSFVHNLSALGLGLGPLATLSNGAQQAHAPERLLHELELKPFVDELPLPQRIIATPHSTGANRLRITMREIHVKVHRDLPPTRLWSYGDSATGPLIEARARVPLQIEWINALPTRHFLPIDYSLHGCGHDIPEVRAVVHVHGSRSRPEDDGGPEDWFVPGQSRVNSYPLQQDAATLWYHDHAMGILRLNHYAGLFGMFLVRDAAEDALHLPSGPYEIPLVIYDRDFTQDGQLHYPTSGDPAHPWVSEFSADAMLINGKIRPFLSVEPRLYRFRLVDAANSRFLRLSFAPAAAQAAPAQPVTFLQIGSDQGLLPSPVSMTALTIAPGERADLLVDFSAFEGASLYLRNGAFEIMQVRVGKGAASHSGAALAPRSSPAPTPSTKLRAFTRLPESAAIKTRRITLNEYQDAVGNSMVMLLNRMHWHEPVTERPVLNTTEIWEFINLTEDTHPMHLHLVRFQVLDRRPFDRFAYLTRNELVYVGPAHSPEANETGWKDVVQCSPGTVTRIIIPFEGFAGRYLYHCHILEHEANDMMRPYEILAAAPTPSTSQNAPG